MPDALREYLMDERHVCLVRLGHIEDLLGLPRSVPPKSRRRNPPRTGTWFDNFGKP